jgi:hypothetical protein
MATHSSECEVSVSNSASDVDVSELLIDPKVTRREHGPSDEVALPRRLPLAKIKFERLTFYVPPPLPALKLFSAMLAPLAQPSRTAVPPAPGVSAGGSFLTDTATLLSGRKPLRQTYQVGVTSTSARREPASSTIVRTPAPTAPSTLSSRANLAGTTVSTVPPPPPPVEGTHMFCSCQG